MVKRGRDGLTTYFKRKGILWVTEHEFPWKRGDYNSYKTEGIDEKRNNEFCKSWTISSLNDK